VERISWRGWKWIGAINPTNNYYGFYTTVKPYLLVITWCSNYRFIAGPAGARKLVPMMMNKDGHHMLVDKFL
jgi:hypothetical protein